MKAKFLMMAAISATAFAFVGCSDDPANDLPESEFEIRQLRLDLVNDATGNSGRSSENPASGTTQIQYVTIDAEGVPFRNANNRLIASTVSLTKPTDAVIAADGDDLTVSFIPGERVNTADVALFNGTSFTLPFHGATKNEETGEITYGMKNDSTFNVGNFQDGALIKGQNLMSVNGSIYNYTANLFVWHYHPINLKIENKSNGEYVATYPFNAELQAVVREQAVDEAGTPIVDEDGLPVFVETNVMTVAPDDKLTLTYEPAYAGDEIAVSMPDGENVVLNAANKTYEWTANQFGTSATVSAALELTQANNLSLRVSTSFTFNAPEEEATPAAE